MVTTTTGKPVENLSAMIRETLLKANVGLKELDEIVVCVGPGSQMGGRAAVATGNALALALEIPITGVFSLDALAATAPASESITTAVTHGRGRWHVAEYTWNGDKLQRLSDLQLLEELPPDALLSCEPDSECFDEMKIGACGVLIVADQQRHLITQSMLEEVTPFERGDGNG